MVSSTLQSVGFAVEAGPSSSAQSALDHDLLSGPKEGVQLVIANLFCKHMFKGCYGIVLHLSFLHFLIVGIKAQKFCIG